MMAFFLTNRMKPSSFRMPLFLKKSFWAKKGNSMYFNWSESEKRKHPWYELYYTVGSPGCGKPLRLSGHTAPSCVCSWGCCTELTACVCPWGQGTCCLPGRPQPGVGALWCQSTYQKKINGSIIYYRSFIWLKNPYCSSLNVQPLFFTPHTGFFDAPLFFPPATLFFPPAPLVLDNRQTCLGWLWLWLIYWHPKCLALCCFKFSNINQYSVAKTLLIKKNYVFVCLILKVQFPVILLFFFRILIQILPLFRWFTQIFWNEIPAWDFDYKPVASMYVNPVTFNYTTT